MKGGCKARNTPSAPDWTKQGGKPLIQANCRALSRSWRYDLLEAFAGHNESGHARALSASLIAASRLNGVNPRQYLMATLEPLANGHSQSDLPALMPRLRTHKLRGASLVENFVFSRTCP